MVSHSCSVLQSCRTFSVQIRVSISWTSRDTRSVSKQRFRGYMRDSMSYTDHATALYTHRFDGCTFCTGSAPDAKLPRYTYMPSLERLRIYIHQRCCIPAHLCDRLQRPHHRLCPGTLESRGRLEYYSHLQRPMYSSTAQMLALDTRIASHST